MPTLRTRLAAAVIVAGTVIMAAPSASHAAWSCVPYARAVSDVKLSGDAWQWWDNASGVYGKGHRPAAGSVIVFKRTSGMRHGHVAVVREVVSSRKIIVDHANWGDGRRGKVDAEVGIIDVSPNNDWSMTKVWYSPIGDYGNTAYPTFGFIYPVNTTHAATSPSLKKWNDHEVDEGDVTPTFSSKALMRKTQPGYSKAALHSNRLQELRDATRIKKLVQTRRPDAPAAPAVQNAPARGGKDVFVIKAGAKAPEPGRKPSLKEAAASSGKAATEAHNGPQMVPVKFVVGGKTIEGRSVQPVVLMEKPVAPASKSKKTADKTKSGKTRRT